MIKIKEKERLQRLAIFVLHQVIINIFVYKT